jgi:hypothetical protein
MADFHATPGSTNISLAGMLISCFANQSILQARVR